jgi:adsorption protein B
MRNLEFLGYLLFLFGFLYLLFGLDDCLVDILAFTKRLSPRKILEAEWVRISKLPEKKIAIIVPAWKESNIISQMLEGNLQQIKYSRYHFFVGCYPNDLATFREVLKISRLYPNVTPILNSLPGPTSKGQLLNFLVDELCEGPYPPFDIYLFQDAEDLIHPLSLKLVNFESLNADFIQLPVFSLPLNNLLGVGGVYIDEFAESHTKDLLVRNHFNVAIPSAGVGTAITRKAMLSFRGSDRKALFSAESLTEDYELGLKAFQIGINQKFSCCYLISEEGKRNYIATREYFPKLFQRSVRQKARWGQGIVFQGWRHLGWFGSGLNRIFLFRDRKALFGNCFGLCGFIFFIVGFGFLLFDRSHQTFTFASDLVFFPLIQINFLILINRILQRTKAVFRVYDLPLALTVVPRWPISVVVNGCAGFLALKNSVLSLATRRPPVWVKTEHELPEGFGRAAETLGALA